MTKMLAPPEESVTQTDVEGQHTTFA